MSLSFGAAAGIGAAVSAISAGGSMISAGIKNRKMWKYRQREMALQQKYALEQMQAQYDFNKKMWDESNKYNDPSAIFDRFRKAGINPAGVLGSSGASLQASFPMNGNVSAPGLGPSTAGDVSAPDFSDVAPSGVQAALAAYSTDSEVERNEAAAERDRAEARSIDDQNVGHQLYVASANARIALDEAITKHNLAARDVLEVQESIEKNNLFISDATLLSAIDEKKNQAALVAGEVKRLGIENENLGKLMSAQALMMNTQAALNVALANQARQVIENLRLNNIDTANELARNWDKRFEVEIPNPQYEKNLRSSNPINRANPGPRFFKVSMSLKDFYDKTIINQANASDFLPEEARIALRNAKLDPYIEISKALVGVAGSLGGAGIIRGGMSRASSNISSGGSSGSTTGSSLTTRYDARGNIVGYVKTEMNRSGYGSTYGQSRSSR